MSLELNLRDVYTTIAQALKRSGRAENSVTLMAVTKTHPVAVVADAARLGLRDFGENYVQEALAKKVDPALKNWPDLRWHFIGHLQTNKVRLVVGEFACLQAVDSARLVRAISAQAQKIGVVQKIMLQVRIGDETTKSGVNPEELEELIKLTLSLPSISLQGLMTIPKPSSDEAELRQSFRCLRQLRDRMQSKFLSRDCELHPLNALSMGMSADFAAAIEEGATVVRLGTILFGARNALALTDRT